MEVRPIAQVRVWNRTARRAQDFAADTRWADVDVQAVRAVRDAVGEADIVVTATSSREPLVRPDWIRPGTHITAMGADFVGKQELDPAMFDRADVIVADDVTACRRVGELQHARDETARTTVSFANVVAGLVPGRASDSDITIIDQIGLGVYDAAIATAALEAVLARLTTAPLEPRGTDATNPQPRLR
jgi:ornithine cyclodeaminase